MPMILKEIVLENRLRRADKYDGRDTYDWKVYDYCNDLSTLMEILMTNLLNTNKTKPTRFYMHVDSKFIKTT